MVRELLRRSLQVVISSATTPSEDRLRRLEDRMNDMECRQTDFETNLRGEMEDSRAEVREWAGVEGHHVDR